jgi:hypothetical protein
MAGVSTSLRTITLLALCWGALAAILFGIAAWLTWTIVQRNQAPYDVWRNDFQEVGIFVKSRSDATKSGIVRYQYDERKASAAILLSAEIAAAKIMLNHVLGPHNCVDLNHATDNGIPRPLKLIPILAHRDFEGSAQGSYLIEWNADYAPLGMRIRCEVTPIVVHETYTARRILFINSPAPTFYVVPADMSYLSFGPPLSKLTLDLSDMGEIDNISFRGGLNAGQSWSSRDLVPDIARVSAQWDSIQANSKRDILIVVIGALIALGAATTLEALRPFIDHFVLRRARE